ncbi:hypothetical protein LRH25_11460 [Ideonella azotifigens]|uniref:Uncharacterized protein n=1 Tax=Ideonella azotifigens TaxID=513160 RepID=A0ABP3V0I7_9BURK|nr:hypothetical protein [Ideonella azotifigens]MCD2340959.1 hypothetical protein [Ideonella azotifigens]
MQARHSSVHPAISALLAVSLVANFALFGNTADYAPSIRPVLVGGLLIFNCVLAWFGGARGLRSAEPVGQLPAVAGCLLIAPFVLFALLLGIGPPHEQPPSENDLRFLLLAINSILVGAGLIVLREALVPGGERLYSTLGLACAVLATPLYFLFCVIQRNDYVAEQLGWSWTASVSGHLRELTPLDALSITALFFAGVLTYLATAAFARSLSKAGWLGRGATWAFLLLSGLGLFFLIARGLAYPSMQAAMSHWYTVPGFVAGIPAVPWMMPAAIGVLMLRRCGPERPQA